MPEFVLLLTQSRHVRVLAESLEEAKRFVARADTDDLSSIDRCDGYFHWTLEVLEPVDPTFQWADGKTLYRLDEGSVEEDACEVCRHQPAADWWSVSGIERKYRLCAGCLKLATGLPPAKSEAELTAAFDRLRVQVVAAIQQRQIEEREAWDRQVWEKEG